MNIFDNVKMRKLLNKRAKLKAELMTLENVEFNPCDRLVYRNGMSAERYIKIDLIRTQIMCINHQISQLLNKG